MSVAWCQTITMLLHFVGLASMFLLLVPMAVCFAISSPKHHGFVLGWTGAFYMLGPSVFGSIYAKWFNKYPLGNFFLLVGIFSMILNGLSICFLLPVTDAINQNEDDNENKENETRRVKFYDDDDEKEERWWDRLGLRVITVLPFHLLLWAFAISCGLEQIHFANVSAMAMSYDLVAQAELLPIIGTVSALTAHFVSGWASDKSSKYAPRTVYIVGGQILEALFMIVCIFLGDNAYVLTFSTIIFYTNNGISYTIAPVLIREHFGEKHFARNFGIAVMLAAIFFLGLGAAVGKLYCRHIKDDGNECYGLQCFRDFYILGGVCSMVSVGCCCTLLILEMNRRRLALAEYVEMKWAWKTLVLVICLPGVFQQKHILPNQHVDKYLTHYAAL